MSDIVERKPQTKYTGHTHLSEKQLKVLGWKKPKPPKTYRFCCGPCKQVTQWKYDHHVFHSRCVVCGCPVSSFPKEGDKGYKWYQEMQRRQTYV